MPTLIHFQLITKQHLVGNKVGSSSTIMSPRVSIIGMKTSTLSIMVNGVDTNLIFLETLDYIKKGKYICLEHSFILI